MRWSLDTTSGRIHPMAIRIRKIDGYMVALCAAVTEPEPGDVYFDDTVHHALTTKFALDWETEGFKTARVADPKHVPLIRLAEGEQKMEPWTIEEWIAELKKYRKRGKGYSLSLAGCMDLIKLLRDTNAKLDAVEKERDEARSELQKRFVAKHGYVRLDAGKGK